MAITVRFAPLPEYANIEPDTVSVYPSRIYGWSVRLFQWGAAARLANLEAYDVIELIWKYDSQSRVEPKTLIMCRQDYELFSSIAASYGLELVIAEADELPA